MKFFGVSLRGHLSYLHYLLRHKLFVYRAGRRFGVGRLQLLVHDWSKFLPLEWLAYARHFYGDKGEINRSANFNRPHSGGGDSEFDKAWLFHIHRNPHHPQFWLLPKEDGLIPLPMPERYIREMLADWEGAGLAKGGMDAVAWYMANKDKIFLHPETRAMVEKLLVVE